VRFGPDLGVDPLIYTLVGMGAVAAAIVGAPMTMIMIVLETIGDFTATIGVMVGVVTAAVVVRHWFGYSFVFVCDLAIPLAGSVDPKPRRCGLDQRAVGRADDAP
jgi:hypothetical protein